MSRLVLLPLMAVVAINASAESVTPISDSSVNAQTMASLLAGSGVTVSNANYTTSFGSYVNVGPWYAPNYQFQPNQLQAGEFEGYSYLLGTNFDQGVILSTGNVSQILGINDSVGTTTEHSDTAVNDSVLGDGVFDVVKFSFDVTPANDVLIIDYVFGSEEYLEYVGAFNDITKVTVNGSNCALTPAGSEVTVNTIHAETLPAPVDGNAYPNNNDGVTNSGLYLDNVNGSFRTEMDGFTRRLSCRVAVTPGQTVSVVTGLADAGDAKYDSWIFFRADSIRSEPSADFGDAPDSYRTLAASSGASHTIVEGVYLGESVVTGDSDGFGNGVDYSGGAATDDSDNALASITPVLVNQSNYSISVPATSINGFGADVVGWIDFDRNGVFDPDEASAVVRIANNTYEQNTTLTWSGLGATTDIIQGPTYLRLRIANVGLTTSTPAGAMASGEVEDYAIIVSDGQAPRLLSVTRQSPVEEFTNADSVTFRATFSEGVSNVDAGDFVSVAGSVITTVTRISDSVYDVTVSAISSYDGAVSLALAETNNLLDVEGNSPSSLTATSAQSYQLDNSAPTAPSITGISDDTGALADDGITADNTLFVTGTAEPGATVTLYGDGVEVGTVTADASGNWVYDGTSTTAPDGTFTITATATDPVGNTSPTSAGFVVTVDTVPPT
ncbi:MAG: choice-of-anchor L domain-containing protein, partial [Thalassolituus sp.]